LIEDDVEGSGQGDSVIQEQGPSRPRPKPRPKREIIDLTGESGIQKSRKVEIVIID
jgi:hypothetical protein